MDFGIRCVIAPSFADIFKTNSMQNGLLPVVLPAAQCEELAKDAEEGLELEVDLERQEVRREKGREPVPFEVEAFRRHCLLNGLDDIGLTLQKDAEVAQFESRRTAEWPWLDGFGYAATVAASAKAGRKGMDW